MAELINRAEEILGAHPKLFFFIVMVAVSVMGLSYKAFAQRSVFERHVASEEASQAALVRQLSAMKSSFESKFLLQDINRLDSEIYEIESLGEMLPRDRARLVQLRSQINEARRQLNLLDGGSGG